MPWVQADLSIDLHARVKRVVHALDGYRKGKVTIRAYVEECVRRCVEYDLQRLGESEGSNCSTIGATKEPSPPDNPL